MKKIVTVLGARPQFIKAAVISRVIADCDFITEVIIHTGQHFDTNMSEVFFDEMNIPKPHYNLNINGLGHGAMTGQMLEKIEEVLKIEKPDCVLVYGDTNSTLAGALAAKKLHIKVAHVEAGLRSFNMNMPEEINRILTDRISDYLFAPTQSAINNLRSEGYDNLSCKVVKSGDVMLDAALFYAKMEKKPDVSLVSSYVLCTIHRSENTDEESTLRDIMSALELISERTQVVMPLHPRTRKKLESLEYNFDQGKISFIDPVGYLEMIYLLSRCQLVISDSGGLQKEAFFFKKKCLIVREETEWTELVEGGYNFICGTSKEKILDSYNTVLENNTTDFSVPLYGDGKTGEKIILELQRELKC
tara:strand:- start:18874 stop:19956 length:1083 start_codon:yes stop_codon:yes gene_type:complete